MIDHSRSASIDAVNRRFKPIGIALMMTVAMVAATASAAQAGTFTAGQYPALVVGTNSIPHKLSTKLGVMECAPFFEGKLEAASETLTLEPAYGSICEVGGKEVHTDVNGCDFLLHAGETQGEHDVGGTMDIICPAGQVIDFEVTSMPVCHLTIGAQTGLSALTFTNWTGTGDVRLHFELTELDYTLDMGCPEPGFYTNGTYGAGTTTFIGFKEPGVQTLFRVD